MDDSKILILNDYNKPLCVVSYAEAMVMVGGGTVYERYTEDGVMYLATYPDLSYRRNFFDKLKSMLVPFLIGASAVGVGIAIADAASANTVSQSVAASTGVSHIYSQGYPYTYHTHTQDVLWSRLCTQRYVDGQICSESKHKTLVTLTASPQGITTDPPEPTHVYPEEVPVRAKF